LQQGSPAPASFILLRGRCQVSKLDAPNLAELSEGDLFGEISLALFDRPAPPPSDDDRGRHPPIDPRALPAPHHVRAETRNRIMKLAWPA